MPFHPPPSPHASEIARPLSHFVVLVKDGARPTGEDVAALLGQRKLVSIQRSMGGERLDTITYDLHVELFGARVRENYRLYGAAQNLIVEVRQIDRLFGQLTWLNVLAVGRVSMQTTTISGEETYRFTARFEPDMVGDPVSHYFVWRLDEGDFHETQVDGDIVFNPIVDDLVVGNMSVQLGENDAGVFVDPESVRTRPAQDLQQDVPRKWTIAEAVHYLCWNLNRNELWVTNPTLEEVQNAFSEFPSNEDFRNVRIPIGTPSLAAALDLLLTPFGYSWTLKHSLNSEDPEAESSTEFVFIRRGYGPAMDLWLQSLGARNNQFETMIHEARLEQSTARTVNTVTTLGDRPLREGTFRLLPAWTTEQEEIPGTPVVLMNFQRSKLTPATENVGRKWVANEAGDYIDLRGDSEYGGHLDLAPLLGPLTTIKRRKFEPCLSLIPKNDGDEDLESLGYWLEYSEVAEPEEADWKRFKTAQPFSILEKEMGIYFTGDLPPVELWNILHGVSPAGAGGQERRIPHLRITACVRGDQRMIGFADRRDASPSAASQQLVLDLREKFPDRARPEDAGELTSRFVNHDPPVPADEIDPEEDLQNWAERVQEQYEPGTVSASFVLDAADYTGWEIGDVIRRIRGREIELDGLSIDSDQTRYPQIIGINWLFDGEQRMELLTETYRNESLV